MSKDPAAEPDENVHLIVAEDEDVQIEHYVENWLAFAVFWALASIVFLQFFTRYVLNDSLAWTEEIARYGLIWVTFIGAAIVARKNLHISVEVLLHYLPAIPARLLLAVVDVIKAAFHRAARLLLADHRRADAVAAHGHHRSADEHRLWRRRPRLLPDAHPAAASTSPECPRRLALGPESDRRRHGRGLMGRTP